MLKWLVVFFALSLIVPNATADAPNIPASSWEQHPEGIALRLTWQGNSITTHIKNTSNTVRELASQGTNSFVSLFYVDEKGASIPLGNPPNPAFEEETQKTLGPTDIMPGKEVAKSTILTPDQLILIKTRPVKCSVVVYDPATKQQSTVESVPKVLTEALGPAPAGK